MVFPEYAARFKKDMVSERQALGSVGFVDDADFAVLDSNGNVESYGRSEDFGDTVSVLAERDRNIQNGHLLTDTASDGPDDSDEDAEYEGEGESLMQSVRTTRECRSSELTSYRFRFPVAVAIGWRNQRGRSHHADALQHIHAG